MYLTRYYRGEDWNNEYSKREIFTIPSPDQIFFLLEYVFAKKHEFEWVTDVGSWGMTLENRTGEKFFFSGALLDDHDSIYTWASEIIRKELNLFSLYLFDGKYEERPAELVFCKVQFDDYGKEYMYLADTDTYHEGDYAVVPAGPDNHEAIVKIVSIIYRKGAYPLYPLNKVKHIIRKYEEPIPGKIISNTSDPPDRVIDNPKEWNINFDLSEEHEAAYNREQYEKTMRLMETVDQIGRLMNTMDRNILQFSDVFYVSNKADIQNQVLEIMQKYCDSWEDPRNLNLKKQILPLNLGKFVPCTLVQALTQFTDEWKKVYYRSDKGKDEIDILLLRISQEIMEQLGSYKTYFLALSDEDRVILEKSKVYCPTILQACCFLYGDYLFFIMLSFLD